MNPTKAAYAAVIALCVIWGTTYLALSIGVSHFPPFLFSAIRQTLAGLVLTSFFLLRGYRLPKWSDMKMHALNGFLLIGLGNGLVSWGELHVSSGLAAVLCATTPFFVVGLNLLFAQAERPTARTLAGLVLGFVGVALIFLPSLSDITKPEYLWGALAVLIASLAWAFGSLLNKHHKAEGSAFYQAGYQLLFGGLFLGLGSLAFDNHSDLTMEAPAVWALAYLTVFGSLIAFSIHSFAMQNLPASQVTVYAYVNPVVALLLGFWLLNEPLSPHTLLALAFILLSVYFINFKPKSSYYRLAKIKLKAALR